MFDFDDSRRRRRRTFLASIFSSQKAFLVRVFGVVVEGTRGAGGRLRGRRIEEEDDGNDGEPGVVVPGNAPAMVRREAT